MSNKVVITGLGVVSPVGNTVVDFWSALREGRSGIRPLDFDTEGIGVSIGGQVGELKPAGLAPKELRRLSRPIVFAVEAADQACRQAGFSVEDTNPRRCGVLVGTGIGGIEDIDENSVKFHTKGPRRVAPMFIPRALANMASGQVAIQHGFRGPNRCMVTACASGTQAIGAAADLIRMGKADVMLAGGTEAAVNAFTLAGFAAMRALSTRNDAPTEASRPFDKNRDGFVMGEGAGIVLLESEAHACARGAEILAELAGLGESCDAYHATAPMPDGSGPALAMELALEQAGVNPGEVDYCNAHGTSTPLNDAGECKALRTVFGEAGPLVSSSKSMVGHLLGAAGAVEAVGCVMTIRDGVIHPNINYETPDPECDARVVGNVAREQKVAIVLSNSLGFGGHNASILLRAYE